SRGGVSGRSRSERGLAVDEHIAHGETGNGADAARCQLALDRIALETERLGVGGVDAEAEIVGSAGADLQADALGGTVEQLNAVEGRALRHAVDFLNELGQLGLESGAIRSAVGAVG